MLAPRSSLEPNSPFLTDGNVRSLQTPALPKHSGRISCLGWTFAGLNISAGSVRKWMETDYVCDLLILVSIKFKGNIVLHLNILFALIRKKKPRNFVFRFLFFHVP